MKIYKEPSLQIRVGIQSVDTDQLGHLRSYVNGGAVLCILTLTGYIAKLW